MNAFPFTEAEWEPVQEVALAIVNAGIAEDDVLLVSLRIQLHDLLAGLREVHGDHPVLLETTGDFTDDEEESAALYRQAVEIAEANGLPTLSIRLALAFTLMVLGQPMAALEELRVCGSEAAAGDADELSEWVQKLGWAPDFTEDDAERVALYRRAIEIAEAQGQPILDLRLALDQLLIDIGKLAD